MNENITTYYLMIGTFREQPSTRIDKIQQAIDSIRNLPFAEEDIIGAIALLGAGLAAEKELKDIKL